MIAISLTSFYIIVGSQLKWRDLIDWCGAQFPGTRAASGCAGPTRLAGAIGCHDESAACARPAIDVRVALHRSDAAHAAHVLPEEIFRCAGRKDYAEDRGRHHRNNITFVSRASFELRQAKDMG